MWQAYSVIHNILHEEDKPGTLPIMTQQDVVTRFPPSPTGFMHIGNARTALFNWLYARAKGGCFVLRIEDTDRTRHSEEAVQVIYDGLAWLGLGYDNTPVSQYENRARHADIARELLEKGQAYYCYASQAELDEMREKARAEGRPPVYDRRWRDADPNQAPEGVSPVIRIKAPIEGETVLQDLVQGEVRVHNEQLDDFILMRSDGSPTYMLAVAVDDYDMGITHVIRGNDHLNNTFRQRLIHKAMGWTPPLYAHLPLICGQDGAKFSKRHGAESLLAYRDMGYLPEAMCNYLLRLGWGHGDVDLITMEEAAKIFDLSDIGASPARFDPEKLDSMNTHYIRQADNARLARLLVGFLPAGAVDPEPARLEQAVAAFKDRSATLKEMAADLAYFAYGDEVPRDEKAEAVWLAADRKIMADFTADLRELAPFDAETVKQAAKQAAESHGAKMKDIGMPLRAAITGTVQSPDIFASIAILGRDKTLLRLRQA